MPSGSSRRGGRLSPGRLRRPRVSAGAAGLSAPPATLDGAVIARVEPLTTPRRLSGPFDYVVDGEVGVGTVLKIPFGHQKLDGVVVGLAESSALPDEKLV